MSTGCACLKSAPGRTPAGKWTVQQAAELSVASPTIEAALDGRFMSGLKEQRMEAAKAFQTLGLHEPTQQEVRAVLSGSTLGCPSSHRDCCVCHIWYLMWNEQQRKMRSHADTPFPKHKGSSLSTKVLVFWIKWEWVRLTCLKDSGGGGEHVHP